MYVTVHLLRLSVAGFSFMYKAKARDSAALHTSKDLAVSPYTLPYRFAPVKFAFAHESKTHSSRGAFTLSGKSVSARTSKRIAPHDGYYPLLGSMPLTQHGCVRTFLPLAPEGQEGDRQRFCIIQQINYFGKTLRLGLVPWPLAGSVCSPIQFQRLPLQMH